MTRLDNMPKILVVDDLETERRIVEGLLLGLSHVAVCAKSGREALDVLQSQPVDCVLIDLVLPGMNGFDLCKKINSMFDPCKVPVVFMTARVNESDRFYAELMGARAFLNKPLRRLDLQNALSFLN